MKLEIRLEVLKDSSTIWQQTQFYGGKMSITVQSNVRDGEMEAWANKTKAPYSLRCAPKIHALRRNN